MPNTVRIHRYIPDPTPPARIVFFPLSLAPRIARSESESECARISDSHTLLHPNRVSKKNEDWDGRVQLRKEKKKNWTTEKKEGGFE